MIVACILPRGETFPSLQLDFFLKYNYLVLFAGHYIPQLAIVLLDHNVHSTGFKFNLRGVAVRH